MTPVLDQPLPLKTERAERHLEGAMEVATVSADDPSPILSVSEVAGSLSDPLDEADSADEGGIFEWTLPPSVRYLSSYLEQQKEHILYGLMTIVTLRSINHENICCINTSLLIFIYAHKRCETCPALPCSLLVPHPP
jgi:hypothetical protein